MIRKVLVSILIIVIIVGLNVFGFGVDEFGGIGVGMYGFGV